MNYSIRQSDRFDIFYSLHEKIFPGDDYPSNNGLVLWLITERFSNRYVGFCTLNRLSDGIIFFSRAGILKGHRGNNLHNRMIKTRERYARKNGFSHIITYTIKDNPNSFCHLIKHGYKIYEPDYAWVGRDVFYFIKDLD